ncbi:MAG: hypothetical protein WAU16_01810 [Rhizobiaceae bacterium]
MMTKILSTDKMVRLAGVAAFAIAVTLSPIVSHTIAKFAPTIAFAKDGGDSGGDSDSGGGNSGPGGGDSDGGNSGPGGGDDGPGHDGHGGQGGDDGAGHVGHGGQGGDDGPNHDTDDVLDDDGTPDQGPGDN